jgi:hypothetical protein
MKKEIKSIQLTMSEGQAKTIINALDFYSRIGMGQFMEFESVMSRSFGKTHNEEATHCYLY